MTTEAALCHGCAAALATAFARRGRPAPCRDCGAQYEVPRELELHVAAAALAPLPPPKPRRGRSTAAPRGDVVTAFVTDLLAWDAAVARVTRAAHGDRSVAARVVEVGELGVHGSGCSGTKGVGRAPTRDVDVHVDPIAQARYQALRGDALRTADAVIVDGQGFQLVEIVVERRKLDAVTLEQRVGMRLAETRQLLTWHRKVREGDSRPVLIEAEATGTAALEAAAKAWWDALAAGSR